MADFPEGGYPYRHVAADKRCLPGCAGECKDPWSTDFHVEAAQVWLGVRSVSRLVLHDKAKWDARK